MGVAGRGRIIHGSIFHIAKGFAENTGYTLTALSGIRRAKGYRSRKPNDRKTISTSIVTRRLDDWLILRKPPRKWLVLARLESDLTSPHTSWLGPYTGVV